MIGLLILATELVKGSHGKVRDRETQSVRAGLAVTSETGALPKITAAGVVGRVELKSLNRSIVK